MAELRITYLEDCSEPELQCSSFHGRSLARMLRLRAAEASCWNIFYWRAELDSGSAWTAPWNGSTRQRNLKRETDWHWKRLSSTMRSRYNSKKQEDRIMHEDEQQDDSTYENPSHWHRTNNTNVNTTLMQVLQLNWCAVLDLRTSTFLVCME